MTPIYNPWITLILLMNSAHILLNFRSSGERKGMMLLCFNGFILELQFSWISISRCTLTFLIDSVGTEYGACTTILLSVPLYDPTHFNTSISKYNIPKVCELLIAYYNH